MTSPRKIAMFQPSVADSAVERVAAVLRGRWIGQGEIVDQFERALEMKLGLMNAVAVNCASSAIRLALCMTGVKPGDEVVTTPMTCTLTNHPILEQFATPVFADIEPDTGNIDPADVQRRITSRTRAILCTHWGGTPPDLDRLNEVARRHGIPVIEDASEAVGAFYKGRPVGSHSRFAALSFQAVQILTTGEGGALVTIAKEDADCARVQRWYGIDRKRRSPNVVGYYDFDVTRVGFGYHFTNVAAAIGLGNLEQLDEGLAARRRCADRLRRELANVAGLTLCRQPNESQPSNHYLTVHVERRENFCRKLREHGIETSIVHARNDAYTVFGGLRRDLPNLDRFDRTYICLPTHPGLTPEDLGRIVEVIRGGW